MWGFLRSVSLESLGQMGLMEPQAQHMGYGVVGGEAPAASEASHYERSEGPVPEARD